MLTLTSYLPYYSLHVCYGRVLLVTFILILDSLVPYANSTTINLTSVAIVQRLGGHNLTDMRLVEGQE